MNAQSDHRAFERIPVEGQVRVKTKGRISMYALAINISMGGLLLGAMPPMPVGSTCELAMSLAHVPGVKNVVAKGIVIRSDDQGTAIQFAHVLESAVYEKIVKHPEPGLVGSLLTNYSNYFKVSQDKNYTGCEALMGVSKATFKRVILGTFSTIIPLAIAPVWLFHSSIPALPNWVKVLLAFGYGLVWLAVVQPFTDLLIFKFLKSKK